MVESPSTEILIEYFGEYSLSRKAYRMQGGEDPLFREVARVLLEYGFVHSRPPTIPKYRAGFVIATYKGLKVDWVTIITECLKSAIQSVAEGKKSWMGVAQWLTLLVSPVLAIKPKKRDREQRAEEPAPTVVVETQEREEPISRQSDEPAGQPDTDKEQVLPQGLNPRQP